VPKRGHALGWLLGLEEIKPKLLWELFLKLGGIRSKTQVYTFKEVFPCIFVAETNNFDAILQSLLAFRAIKLWVTTLGHCDTRSEPGSRYWLKHRIFSSKGK